jgi:putative transposase
MANTSSGGVKRAFKYRFYPTAEQAAELAFLNEVSSVPLQQALRHLQTAFANFYAKRARYPRFKAKKRTGSNNRAKAQVKLARAHAWIADARRDHLHKLSTRLVRENQAIVVEDLNVAGMARNHALARAISDAAWSDLRSMLEYKARWYGRELLAVDRWCPSSKTCSACGHLVGRLPMNVRAWVCPRCAVVHDRDVNAARNILAAGLADR